MNKAIVFLLTAILNDISAAEELSERASKIKTSLPIDLDGTTVMKAAAAAAKGRVRPNKYPAKIKKQSTFFIDDPEIFTDKRKTVGGTTLDSVGKAGVGIRASERAIPAFWGGGGQEGGRVQKTERTWVGKGTKQKSNWFFQDDPEIFTNKKKTVGGTTLESVGKGKQIQAPSRGIPTYWGGKGNTGDSKADKTRQKR